MGPGVTNQGTPAAFLETPATGGVMVIEPTTLEPEFEGFTPLSQYITTDLNMSAPNTGTYYIAVYDETHSGRYALVTGYVEAYTIIQWMLVPFMAITILVWSGQELWMILVPMIIPLLLGLGLIYVRQRPTLSKEYMPSFFGMTAGLLFLGSGVSIFSQMIYALLSAPPNWTVIASIIFGSLPIILGLALIRIVQSETWTQSKKRGVYLVVLGILGLFVWAGLLIGPALAILAGLVPFVTRPSD
jgi:hypothetical protein